MIVWVLIIILANQASPSIAIVDNIATKANCQGLANEVRRNHDSAHTLCTPVRKAAAKASGDD